MPIKFICESCSSALEVQERFAGQLVCCPDCDQPNRAPHVSRRRSSRRNTVRSDYDPDDYGPVIRPKRQSKKKKKSNASGLLPLVIGATILGVVLMCAGIVTLMWPDISSSVATAAKSVESGPTSTPRFPELGMPVRTFDSGVRTYFVDFGRANSSGLPGYQAKLRVYMPAGNHGAQSLPCVLVAPAGTNLIRGSDMDADDYHKETLPYARAGYVTIFYSLDGALENDLDPEQVVRSYRQFKAVDAGVVNGKNAIEFALARIPEVDPTRIYTAGHSSAGTLSLLMATRDKRVAGCIAYAPCADVESFLAELLRASDVEVAFPGIGQFLSLTSPMNSAGELTCPLFLFHVDDDQIAPIGESRRYLARVGTPKSDITFLRVPSGGHYEPMIEDGIPAAIEKLNEWSRAN